MNAKWYQAKLTVLSWVQQAANAMLPLAKSVPVFLSAAEIKGLDGLQIYQSKESGELTTLSCCLTKQFERQK